MRSAYGESATTYRARSGGTPPRGFEIELRVHPVSVDVARHLVATPGKVRDQVSRLTVSGENAGRHTATYVAPPGAGLL